MKKTFVLEDLGCANCAAKMEDAINRLDMVESASISFMQQRLTLQAPDDRFDDAVAAAKKVMKKIEPDVRVVM